MKIEEEIEFVLGVITHPVGYDLGLFGTMCARSTDQGVWCVSWEEKTEVREGEFETIEVEQCFPTPQEAAEFFVRKRIADEIGLDFENALLDQRIPQT